MITVNIALFLIALLLIKHFVADYPLQTDFMLKKNGPSWFYPLLQHSSLHGFYTFCVICGLGSIIGFSIIPIALGLGVLDLVIHFCVDYLKAQKFKYDINDKKFWNALGLDQLAHGLTYILIVFILSIL